MTFALRFDFRNPARAATSMADRLAAAVDMAEWADELGGAGVYLSEHHGVTDGYVPSPLPVVAAMASRTKNLRFSVIALIAPFHDPLRLAEDIAVVDQLAKGRLDIVIAGGYVPSEFAMFGVDVRARPALVAEMVSTLKAAFRGEPFSFRNRTVQVTPPPFQPGGPAVTMGGSSEGAARRAARLADGFVPSDPTFWEFYVDECQKLGKDPGPMFGGDTRVTLLAEDAEEGWAQRAPYFLHEMNGYGAWQQEVGLAGGYEPVTDTEALRATGQYRVVTGERYVRELRDQPFPFAMLHPMCGGIPPGLAWESLRLFEREVLPALRG